MRTSTERILSVEHAIHCLADLEVHEDGQAPRQECGRVVHNLTGLVETREVCLQSVETLSLSAQASVLALNGVHAQTINSLLLEYLSDRLFDAVECFSARSSRYVLHSGHVLPELAKLPFIVVLLSLEHLRH